MFMTSIINVNGRGIRIQGRLIRTARLAGEKCVFLEDPEPVIQGLRQCGVRIDLFTFLQRLPETSPKYAYSMEWDNLAVLEVSTVDHWWNHQIRSYARNRARQAEKRGVTLREVSFDESLARGMCEVYNESPVRQGRPNAHYGKDVETVYKEAATFLEKSIFIGAFIGETLIGFVKLVTDETRTQANLMNIVSMIKHRDKAPTNALIAHSVRACAERGIPYLVYQNLTYGNKKPDGLTNFKEVNGFQRVDVPRYYIPLTPIGRAALRLQLHRRFVDRLPAPVAEKVRELMNAWYNRKLPPVIEAS
jgi:hypothetical protein